MLLDAYTRCAERRRDRRKPGPPQFRPPAEQTFQQVQESPEIVDGEFAFCKFNNNLPFRED